MRDRLYESKKGSNDRESGNSSDLTNLDDIDYHEILIMNNAKVEKYEESVKSVLKNFERYQMHLNMDCLKAQEESQNNYMMYRETKEELTLMKAKYAQLEKKFKTLYVTSIDPTPKK